MCSSWLSDTASSQLTRRHKTFTQTHEGKKVKCTWQLSNVSAFCVHLSPFWFPSQNVRNESVRNKVFTHLLLKLSREKHRSCSHLMFDTHLKVQAMLLQIRRQSSLAHTVSHKTAYLWKDLGTCRWSSSSSTSRVWKVFLETTACLAAAVTHGHSGYWWHCQPRHHSWPVMTISPTHQLEDRHEVRKQMWH